MLSGTTTAGVNYNLAAGVAIWDAGFLTTANNVVQGNYIGTDITGSVALGNAYAGVDVQSNDPGSGNNLIAGNLISGNTAQGGVGGVVVNQSNGVTIQGNLIGTNAVGTAALPNSTGILVVGSQDANITIGGPSAPGSGPLTGVGNLVSGNLGTGIAFDNTVNTIGVYGNWVGTDITGTVALPNQGRGITVSSNNVVIGGVGLGNVISGNHADGLSIDDGSGNVVQSNLIGTNPAGTAAIANQGQGVLIDQASTGNTIGGTAAGTGNVISGNVSAGVNIQGSGTTGNVVEGNTISHNTGDGVFINGVSGNTVGVAVSPNAISGNGTAGIEVSGAAATIFGGAGTAVAVDAPTTATVAVGSTTVNGQAVTYSGSVDLTVSGNADIKDLSGTLTGLHSLTVTGTAILDSTGVSTAGGQTYDGWVSVVGNDTAFLGRHHCLRWTGHRAEPHHRGLLQHERGCHPDQHCKCHHDRRPDL